MKVLITGAAGQLGLALTRTQPSNVQVVRLARAELDITDPNALLAVLTLHKPNVVINAAAYTLVDQAQSDPQSAEQVNAVAPGAIALACHRAQARLIHVSTDYVFDGTAHQPYLPESTTQPLGVYGASKRRGEIAVLQALGTDALVVRTSWLYAATGRNFLTRMLELMRERPQLKIVMDQIGAPTLADDLAQALWTLTDGRLNGIQHWCNSGVASWYDFAVAIAEEAHTRGLLAQIPSLLPIISADYPTPAVRPHFSVLDKRRTEVALGVVAPHWRSSLRCALDTLTPTLTLGRPS